MSNTPINDEPYVWDLKHFKEATKSIQNGEASLKIDGVNASFKLVDGALGKEFAGTWHLEDGKAIIQWSNGWTDVLGYSGGVYRQDVYRPGMDMEKDKPMTTTVVETADGRPYGN